MATSILCCIGCLLVFSGAVTASQPILETRERDIKVDTGWQVDHEYEYEVHGVAATSLPAMGGSGKSIEIRATLRLQRINGGGGTRNFLASVQHARMAEQPQSTSSHPKEELHFHPMQLSPGAWQLHLSERGVASLFVNRSLPTAEVNFIKALASRLVLNTGGAKHLGPVPDIQFSVMEESVSGRCETAYEVAVLGEEQALARPQLAPLVLARLGARHDAPRPADAHRRLVSVVKSRNYERCQRRPGLRRHGAAHSPPAYLTTEEVIIEGNLEDYTIHSSTVEDQVNVGTTSSGDTQGLVETRLNVTLVGVKQGSSKVVTADDLRSTDLVFEYDTLSMHSPQSLEKKVDSEDANSFLGSRSCNNNNACDESASNTEEDKASFSGNENHKDERTNASLHSKFDPLFNITGTSPLIPPLVRSLQFLGNINVTVADPLLGSLAFPQNIPLQRFFVRNIPNENVRNTIYKLVSDIAFALENPNKIPQKHTLSSFSILIDLLRTLNFNSLSNISQEFEKKKSSNNNNHSSPENFIWLVWREAVAQTGSGPALLLLASWIEGASLTRPKGPLAPDEAPLLLRPLPAVAWNPDDAYLQRLFDLVVATEPTRDSATHRAALLALADLLWRTEPRGQARSRPGGRTFLNDAFLPYATRGLRRAAAEGNEAAALAYVRAIGAAGSARALLAFKPYLDGSVGASQTLRAAAAAALERAARARPRVLRRALAHLCLNARDATEVRVAAAFVLVRSRPGAALLRRLARAAVDPAADRHFRAAVRSALAAAAASVDPDDAQLAAGARAALQFSKFDSLSLHYSRTASLTERVNPNEIYKSYVDFIGSEDSLLPKAVTLNFLHKFVGEEPEMVQMGFTTNSVDQLLGTIERAWGDVASPSIVDVKATRKIQHKESYSSQNLSIEWLRKALGMKDDASNFLTGSMFFQGFGETYFQPFGYNFAQKINHWIAELQEVARAPGSRQFRVARLRAGAGTVYFQPSSLGIATFVRADAPSTAIAEGNLTLGNALRRAIDSRLKVRFLYSSKSSVRFGFSLPFAVLEETGGSVFEAGVERNLLLQLPLDLRLRAAALSNAFSLNTTVAPLRRDEEERLVHYSVIPYICRQNAAHAKPPLESKAAVVRAESLTNEERRVVAAAGSSSLVAARAGPASSSSVAGLLQLLPLGPALASALRSALPAWAAPAIAPALAPPRDPARLDLFLAPRRADAHASASLAFAIRNGPTPTINATLRIFGNNHPQCTASGEYSSVAAAPEAPAETTRLRASFQCSPTLHQSSFQASLCVNGSWANVPLTAFEDVMAAEHSANVTTELVFGKNSHSLEKFNLQCRMSRSEERERYLRNHPLTAECERSCAAGDRLLSACRNVTMRAGYLDQYYITAKVPPSLHYVSRKALEAARALGYSYLQEVVTAPFATTPGSNGIVTANVTFLSGGLRSARVVMDTADLGHMSREVSIWDRLPIPSLLRPLIVTHPRYSAARRMARKLLNSENTPTCVVDVNFVNTFDNSTYPVRLGSCWRVALATVERAGGRREEAVAVLVRDAPHGRRDVKLLLGSRAWDLGSAGDADRLPEGARRLPGGALLLDTPRAQLRLLVDGTRVVLVAGDALRARVRGLCGTLAGRPPADFTSPGGCLLTPYDPHAFVSAWTVPDESCRPALPPPPKHCVGHRVAPGRLRLHDVNVILKALSDSNSESLSDSDYDSAAGFDHEPGEIQEYDSVSRSREDPAVAPVPTILPWMGACLRRRVRLVREGTRVCFSVEPLPECSPHCSATRLMRKSVPFHCAHYNAVTQQWADRVMQGDAPDFSQKAPNRWIVLSLAIQCV